MTRWPSQLLLLLSVAAALHPVGAPCVGAGVAIPNADSIDLYPATVPTNKTPLVIGYLTAIKGELKDRQGLTISGALTLALDEVRSEFG